MDEHGIQFMSFGFGTVMFEHVALALGIFHHHLGFRFEPAGRTGEFAPFGQHFDNRGIHAVDFLAQVFQRTKRLFGHLSPQCCDPVP